MNSNCSTDIAHLDYTEDILTVYRTLHRFLTDLARPTIFAFQLRDVAETFLAKQNVRSGHIYLSADVAHIKNSENLFTGYLKVFKRFWLFLF